MDLSSNKAFLAGALSALSNCKIVAENDTKTSSSLMLSTGTGIRPFNLDSLHKHTLKWMAVEESAPDQPLDSDKEKWIYICKSPDWQKCYYQVQTR